ncbi:hypothetical protein E1264_11525 [Actinomadura sp. KC216]|uniref:hypothetical protein n=1 Tax=Actinomadura sp. KC216 TaxID=2530370 RepID=UPI001051A967|nr:hypothetical protein [Actinomadura sp. KC216]TDB88401.1 hypothetical protein E1264_11525 [Actinomadura sp. KC216]
MSVPPPSRSQPELRVTLGRGAYRRPLRIGLAALAVGLLVSLSTRTGDGAAWAPGEARRVVTIWGGGGALIALAAALWAFVIFRNRLVVTIGEKGLVLRRARHQVVVPGGAVRAVGIVWPVADPVWTVWLDTEAAPDVAAVAKMDGGAIALHRSRSLPSGWLPSVRTAATETLGAAWRVLDDEGGEVEEPRPDALSRADRLLVDGTGRYRDQGGGGLVAIACGRLARRGPGPARFRRNPDRGRRTIVLRDPHAGRLLAFKKTSRLAGGGRMRVFDADGRHIGTINRLREPSFHAAGGTLLGTTRRHGDRHVVTGVDGRESASLRTRSGADDGRMWLERSRSAPDLLRTLTLALPMVVRLARQSS